MNLSQYLGRHIRITTDDGQVFAGVGDYHISALDNPDGVATICVGDYELREDEIAAIEVLSADVRQAV